MPANIVKSFAEQTGKSEAEVEKLWKEAKAVAAEAGHEEEYDYIVGILKKMLKLNEEVESFREFLIQKQVEKYEI